MLRLTAALLGLTRLLSLVHGFIEILNGLRARQINAGQFPAAYDHIIVVGGQSGVVVGSCLSETNSKSDFLQS